MEMWQSRSASMLLFSQGIYGVGTILGPLVVRPYLTGEFEYPDDLIITNSTNSNSTSDDDADELARTISAKLKTPFLIDGIIVLLGKHHMSPCLIMNLKYINNIKYNVSLTNRC